MSENLTVTDLFCGAGGSSSGAHAVAGVRVRMAANHWRLAVETHNTNHPDTDHDVADISQVDPRRYPKTDILWASPECTNHSIAKGVKKVGNQPDLFGDTLPDEAAERSRATMWDVPRFAEHHRYDAVIVENVVDVTKWVMFPAWQQAMKLLGYDSHLVFLNSMHAQAMGAPAPQSRDRVYIVLWKQGNRMPDFNRWTRPKAYCGECDEVVEAIQSWKNGKEWGRYRSQYLWRCPKTSCRNSIVEPGFLPAATAIDWDLPGELIAERGRPLSPKTLARIEAGLRKFGRPISLEAAGNTFERRPGVRTWPLDDPLTTLHTTASKALAYSAAMLVPVEGREGKEAMTIDEVMRTQTTRNETALLYAYDTGTLHRPGEVPLPTQTTVQGDAMVYPPFIAELRGGGSDAREITEPLATFTASGNHHGLVVPPGMVMRNNGSRGDGGEMCTPLTEELRTITTKGHQSVVTWEDRRPPSVEECYFRMLEPHEVQAGMAFARDYEVLGNKRERVKQLGNAVTPPAARDLIAAVAESLTLERSIA